MAPRQQPQDIPPPYSHCPTINERVLAIAPDFSLAIDAIQVVQEWFPGTSAESAWEFIQQLAHLVRADVRNRWSGGAGTNCENASERVAEDDPPTDVPEDSPMPNTT